MKITPQLLCIGGMHGHGHYALRSLFDGHPDIVAYPFFMANLFRYWRYGNLSQLTGRDLAEAVWPLVNNDPIFEASIGLTKAEIGFDDQSVCSRFELLLERLERPHLPDVLRALIQAFHETCSAVKTPEPKYYAFEVDCREFPWDDAGMAQVTHVFSFRDKSRSYLAHRADFLDRYGWSLPRFLLTRAPLELSQLIYN